MSVPRAIRAACSRDPVVAIPGGGEAEGEGEGAGVTGAAGARVGVGVGEGLEVGLGEALALSEGVGVGVGLEVGVVDPATGPSSFKMVPTACPSPIVAFVGLFRFTKNFSLGSAVVSPNSSMGNDSVVSPGSKVRVLLVWAV